MPTLRDESQSETHLEHAPLERPIQPRLLSSPPDTEVQRKRMLFALGILLLALAAVVIKDWDFWFPSSGEGPELVARRKSKTVPVTPATPSASAATPHERRAAKAAEPAPADVPFAASTERTALPPLEVEVVAGNQHINVPAKSNSIHVDVGSGGTAPSAAAQAPASAQANSSSHVSLSPQIAQRVAVSVPPDYPMLARQMKVQGVVSLQALIARDGTIQELQILSGPDILATAAREAVKQWHFKPYLQNGQPVETQARITVNFTISTN